ncbi:MAG: hypothetical protein HYR63_20610 [Proteobacteria bacterium]|nr:hypothetical protein [Pseudomonadota bacterium]MBI3497122.1 hypothetical protein [Pseudomonadota bacterium]
MTGISRAILAIAGGLFASLAITLPLASAGAAEDPVALVEDITNPADGIDFMDVLPKGKVIKLGAKDTLILGYLKSCQREVITGGTVTVGAEQSIIAGGKVERRKVECDGGHMRLTADQSGKSGVMVFRGAPGKLPPAQLTLYGTSPVISLTSGSGTVVVERLDKPGEKREVTVGGGGAIRSAFFDFARHDMALAAGGLYRASSGGRELVFKVAPDAQPGVTPLVGRAIRL